MPTYRVKDYAMVETDRMQQELEKTLKKLYEEAQRELAKEERAFYRKFESQDADMKAKLDAGQITSDYYQAWRINQIGQDERWKSMRDSMADRITNVDQAAASYINDTTPGIYSLNHNYSLYTIDQYAASGISWNLVDEQTVRELIIGRNHTDFKVKSSGAEPGHWVDDKGNTYRQYQIAGVDYDRTYEWNSQLIQKQLVSGIIQGKSVKGIAEDFFRVMQRNYNAAVRNARTAITSAQNSGRQSSYEQAAAMGIKVEKEWMATADERTRESHVEIDGEVVPYNSEFSNGLMYPGDPDGEPAEVYNCRCTMVASFPGGGKVKQTIPYKSWGTKQITETNYPVIKNKNGNVFYDVTDEYHKMKKGKGNVEYSDGYLENNRDHIVDLETGKLVAKEFGGTVKLLDEIKGSKRQDALFNDKKWEFKEVSTDNSINKQLQSAWKQLTESPDKEEIGGVVLRQHTDDLSKEKLMDSVITRIPGRAKETADYMIFDNNDRLVKVLRYKK